MKPKALFSSLVPTIANLLVVAALVATAWFSYNLGAGTGGGRGAAHNSGTEVMPGTSSAHPADLNGDGFIFTCSMHAQIQQDEPGNCPICGMVLVEVKVDERNPAAGVPSQPEGAGDGKELLGFACAMNCLPPMEESGPCPVCGMAMQPVFEAPEDKGASASPRRLAMSAEAIALLKVETAAVRRGAATREIRLVGQLVEDPRRRTHISANVGGRIDKLYAEFVGDVVTGGEALAEVYSPELLAVQEELLQFAASAQRVGGNVGSGLAPMRRRLELAGLSQKHIDEIISSGVARERIVLDAPVGGTVTARYVEPGDYVERGQRILTLANFDFLWAELEAFDSDLPGLRVGQQVSFNVRSDPENAYTGTISWIDPTTASQVRTTRIRVDVPNPEMKLKPGMYLNATVATASDEVNQPLIIPATAPLLTGNRAIVYTMDEAAPRPTFIGREVILGQRVREGYTVIEGLREGERVVTRGAFQIDSSLQIVAKRSMMSPEGAVRVEGHAGHSVPQADTESALPHELFNNVLPIYLSIQQHLAEDEAGEALTAWNGLIRSAAEQGEHKFHALWEKAKGDGTIAELRVAFEELSILMIATLGRHGNPTKAPLYVAHCPMTFDWKGSDWIQTGDEIRNPYFGAEMYRCGSVKSEVAPR